MATEFTPEELGISPAKREFSPEELGLGSTEKPKSKEGIVSSVKRGAEQLVSSGQTALESITKGGSEAAIRAQDRQADIQRRLGEGASLDRLKDLYNQKGILAAAKELGGQIPSAIAEQVPNIAATLGGAAAGAAAGSVVPGVGTVIGGIAGAFAPSFVQQYGGNIQRQAEAQQNSGAPLNINRAAAAGTAAPMAALDVLGTLIPLGGNMVTKILGPAAGKLIGGSGSKIAEESLLATISKGTIKGIAAEVPTEVTQQMLERAQAGLSLTDDEALKEYGETAFAVSLLGPLGIIGRVSDKAQAGRDLAAAQQRAAETGEPQSIPLQLTYDPTVSGSGGTADLTPFTVFPDGRIAPTQEAAFQEQFQRTPIAGATEAFAVPGDKEAIQAARFAEARANSPAMQKLDEIVSKKQQFLAREQAALDEMKAKQSAFSNAPMEGGVIRPPSAEEIAAQEAKTASYANRVTIAAQENGKLNIYEGQMNPSGKTINVVDPVTGAKKTFNPKQKNIIVDPTQNDIFAFEQQGLTTDLQNLDKEIKDTEKSVKDAKGEFKDWLSKNPISAGEIADILPGMSKPSKNEQGYTISKKAQKYFSVDGNPIDDVAAKALEDGILTQEEFSNPKDTGGVQALIDKIEKIYGNEPIQTASNKDAFAQVDTLYNQKEQLEQELERRKSASAAPTQEEIAGAQPEFIPEGTATPAEPVTPAEYAQREPVNPSFRAEVKTPYSDKFAADGKKLASDFRKALNKMGLKDVGLRFEEMMTRTIDGKTDEITGAYFDNLIRVSLSSSDPIRTLNHEALHAMKDLGMFSAKEWSTLEQMAEKEWMQKYDIESGYGQETKEIQLEEAIAHAFADYNQQTPFVKRIANRVRQFLGQLRSLFNGNGFTTAESVFQRAAEGKLSKGKPSSAVSSVEKQERQKQTIIEIPIEEIEHGESATPGGKLTWPGADELIKEYAAKKTPLPPIEVVSPDEAGGQWMVYDGSHRLEAAKLRGQKTIQAIVNKNDEFGQQLAKNYKEVKTLRAEVPTRAKFKGTMNDVDPDIAEQVYKTFTQENATVKEKMKGLKRNFFERMVTGLFDEFKAIEKFSVEAYMMARLSKSQDGGLQGLLENGQVYLRDGALDIKSGTKGLLSILEPVGPEVDRYQAWKALNRDFNLPSGKRSLPSSLVENRDKLAQGDLNGKSRKSIYEKALREENELNKSVLNVAKELGLIDQEAYNNFASDIYYIPFYKQMEGGDVQSVSAAAKLTGQNFSKSLKGGEKKLNDLMENVLLNWSHILSASMKNQAAVKTIDAAEKMGAAKEVKPIDGKYPKGSVKVMKNGKAVHYELSDPDLVDAISTISYLGPKSAFLDVAKGFTNALRYGITLSPAYKVRNLIRDSIQSAAVSELGPNMFSNVYNGLAMSKDGNPTYMSALAGGGIFEMGSAHEGNQAKLIKRLIDKGVNANQILDTTDKIKGKLQDALEWYNKQGNKFENANRLALYKKLIDSGKTHLEASYAARDLMDFSMQGQFRAVKIIGSVVPFFNARLQGLYKLGRDGITPTYRVICNATTGAPLEIGDKQKALRFGTISSAVMLASLALYGMYKDDEDFKRREDWDRDNFWWFKIGDTAFRVPKPFEIGALGTIAERTYEQISDENVEGKIFFERVNKILADTLSLNPTPQMIKPMIDLYANKDSFTGAPIESAGMENLSKQERMNNKTSGVAIALGGISQGAAKVLTFNPQAEGFSPVQMDYAIKAYFGWLGATATSTADLAVEPFQEGTKVRKPVIDTLAMGFIKTEPETQSKYITQFYENNARFQSALADMRHYAELGDSEKVQSILESKGDEIALAKVYDKTGKQLAALRKQSRIIEQSKDIPPEDKRMEMNRLKILMSDMAMQIEDMRKSLKK